MHLATATETKSPQAHEAAAMAERKTKPSEKRWRGARISLRVHDDLKAALEFLAADDRRTVSQYLEIILLDHVRGKLKNRFADDGALVEDTSRALVLKKAN